MQKEKLTIHNIKTDLRNEIKVGYGRLAEFSGVLLMFIGLFLVVYISALVEVILLKLVLAFGIGVFLILLIVQITDLNKLYKIYKDKNCVVVRDKLVDKKIKRYPIDHRRKGPLLVFPCYGEYRIPDENYTWSYIFPMSLKEVYNCCDCGDEFYLVVSKPHKGKILLAYNAKMFEM